MNKNNWAKHWKNRLHEYQTPLSIPRAGLYIASHFKDIKTSLEIGCGSARDSIYLASKGIKVSACDYEPWLIDTLKEKYKDSPINFFEADAFNLQLSDKSFDLVFNNQVFIYYDNDNDIITMLKEHARITSKYLLIFVNHTKNQRLEEQFEQKGKSDPVFKTRFFDIAEFEKLLHLSGIQYKEVKFFKFGGKADILFMKIIKRIPNIFYPFRKQLIPRLYKFQPWNRTERLGVLIKF